MRVVVLGRREEESTSEILSNQTLNFIDIMKQKSEPNNIQKFKNYAYILGFNPPLAEMGSKKTPGRKMAEKRYNEDQEK